MAKKDGENQGMKLLLLMIRDLSPEAKAAVMKAVEEIIPFL